MPVLSVLLLFLCRSRSVGPRNEATDAHDSGPDTPWKRTRDVRRVGGSGPRENDRDNVSMTPSPYPVPRGRLLGESVTPRFGPNFGSDQTPDTSRWPDGSKRRRRATRWTHLPLPVRSRGPRGPNPGVTQLTPPARDTTVVKPEAPTRVSIPPGLHGLAQEWKLIHEGPVRGEAEAGPFVRLAHTTVVAKTVGPGRVFCKCYVTICVFVPVVYGTPQPKVKPPSLGSDVPT